MVRLVLNGDDLGLAPAHARAVASLRTSGHLTDVSLLACGEAFDEAVRALKEAAVGSAGVHLCLVGGERPLLPSGKTSSLAPGGRFPAAWPSVAARVAAGITRVAEVEAEWEAQVAAVAGAGLLVTHLDSHQHLHLLPRLLPVAVRIARRFGVPWVRAPRGDDPAAEAEGSPPGARLKARLLARLGAGARRAIARAGLPEPPRILGLAEAGRMTEERWESLLDSLSRTGGDDAASFEAVLHPGADEAPSPGAAPLPSAHDWGYAWADEAAALAGARLAKALASAGVTTVSFAELGV